jgi:ferredoxin
MKISVDENLCIGCGTCESMCSACFKMEDGISHVIKEECDDCDLTEVVESCPVRAITVE